MKRGFSVYCDLLRLIAASTVFLSHLSWHRLSGGFLYQLLDLGRPAVVIFFVLSGFVICYVTEERERTLHSYAVSRLARLYSVVLPAIVLTFVLDRIGMSINPHVYLFERETMPLVRAVAAALFLSQSWFTDLSLYSNDAYWSLPYEFWYYVLFGAFIFLRGYLRIAAVAVAALIAGPRILLMFPIWLFGVAAYRLSRREISPSWARAIAIGSFIAVLACVQLYKSGMHFHAAQSLQPFGFVDYFLGFAVAANLLAMSRLNFGFGRAEKFIRSSADMTFSLYLFHLPLLHIVAAILPADFSVYARGSILLVTVPPIVWLLSRATEGRKESLRALLRRWIPSAQKKQFASG